MYKIYICDCETTGLDPDSNDVIEASFLRFSIDKPDDYEQYTWYIKAINSESIQEKAMKINGHSREDVLHLTKEGKEKYLEPKEAIAQIESWVISDDVAINDRVLMAHNASFDSGFLQKLWGKSGAKDTYPFNRNFVIDTLQLTRLIDVCTGTHRERYNLESLVKDFGVTKRNAHRAHDDVLMLRDVFVKQILPIRDALKISFKGV